MKNNWVDIRERVPEHKEEVLVYVKPDLIFNAMFVKHEHPRESYFKPEFLYDFPHILIRNVRWWMPKQFWMPEGVE